MGWIKLNRNICDNWLWKDRPFTKGQAWVDLLLMADYEDNDGLFRGNIKHYKKGNVYRSILYLSERWGWSRDKVRRFLKTLQDEDMITLNATTNDTTITLINWAFYQGGNTTDNTTDNTTGKTTHNTTDNTTGDTHTRNIKNNKEKEEKKEIGPEPTWWEDDTDYDSLPVIKWSELEAWEAANGRKWEGVIEP